MTINLGPNDFEFDTPITVNNLAIKIVPHDAPENPFTDWDCNPPIMVADDRNSLNEFGNQDLKNVLNLFSDWYISHNWREICDILGFHHGDHDELARNHAQHNRPMPLGEARRHIFQEELYEITGSRLLSILASLYAMIGIPAKTLVRTGCSQSEYLNILVVLTPQWRQLTGYSPKDKDNQDVFTSTADLYSYWAFGNVWGYIIEDQYGEYVDSCWGYYGHPYQPQLSHMWDDINEAANRYLLTVRHTYQNRLKALIKNNVPFAERQSILSVYQ